MKSSQIKLNLTKIRAHKVNLSFRVYGQKLSTLTVGKDQVSVMEKKNFHSIFLFLILASVSFISKAHADNKKIEIQTNSSQLESNIKDNSFNFNKPTYSLGLTSMKFHYTESKMSDDTNLYGLVGQMWLPAQSSQNLVFGGSLELLSGNGSYDGQYQNGQPAKSDTKNQMTTLRGLVGSKQMLNDNNRMIYFSGLGSRYLNNKIEGPGGYRREISYLYVPLALDWTARQGESFQYGLAAEYDLFLSGTVKSHLSDVSSSYPDVENHQNSGSGYRLTATMGWMLKTYSINVQPYLHHWQVDDSDRAIVYPYYFYEPKNETTMTGLNVSVAF